MRARCRDPHLTALSSTGLRRGSSWFENQLEFVCDVHAFFSGVESTAVIMGPKGSATLELVSVTRLKSRVS